MNQIGQVTIAMQTISNTALNIQLLVKSEPGKVLLNLRKEETLPKYLRNTRIQIHFHLTLCNDLSNLMQTYTYSFVPGNVFITAVPL